MDGIVFDESEYESDLDGKEKSMEVLEFLCGRLNAEKEWFFHEFYTDDSIYGEVKKGVNPLLFLIPVLFLVGLVVSIGSIMFLGVSQDTGILMAFSFLFGFIISSSILNIANIHNDRVIWIYYNSSPERIHTYNVETAKFIKKALEESKWSGEEFIIKVEVN